MEGNESSGKENVLRRGNFLCLSSAEFSGYCIYCSITTIVFTNALAMYVGTDVLFQKLFSLIFQGTDTEKRSCSVSVKILAVELVTEDGY